jgi:hypothetical protein
MREYWRYFFPLFIALFVIAFGVVESLQDAGALDSIGLWYTIYCAAAFSVPAAAVLAFFGDTLFSGWWKIRR